MMVYSVIRRNGLKRSSFGVVQSKHYFSTIDGSLDKSAYNANEELIKVANEICKQKYERSKLHEALTGLQGRLTELKSESFNILKTRLDQVKFEGALENTRANLLLQVLLLDPNTEHNTVYKFIVKHLQYDLNFETLETFLCNLITNDNLPAATILIHILLKNFPKFTISNELWSLYMSKVCDSSYLHGATMVYHELIDNYLHYNDTRTVNITLENDHIPFLITTSLLERLAWIFTHNKDSSRIQGIIHYFKRFYSYHGHQDTYKSLLFSLVESYSYEEDLSNAIKSFKNMSFRFQGHLSPSKKESLDNILKISAFNNFRWRRNNIKNNVSSDLKLPYTLKNEKNIQEEIIAETANIELFNPIIERNVYSSPQIKHIGIIKGKFKLSDLPYFKSLIKKNVNEMMNNKSNHRITQLINLITSSHYMIQPFVVSSLCELGYIREAFSIILKLPSAYPNLSPHSLRNEECFISLFEICNKIKIDDMSNNSFFNNQSLVDFCVEIKNYYLSVSLKNNISSKVCSLFLSAILRSNILTSNRVKLELNQIFQKDPSLVLHLQSNDYDKLQLYNIDYPQIKKI